MYQKFLLEIFYPSNLLEIFLGCISSWVSGVIGSSQVAPLCARIVYYCAIFRRERSDDRKCVCASQAILKHFQGRFFCIPNRQQTCLIDWILWLSYVEVSCMGEGPFRWLIFVHLAPVMKQIKRSRGRLL